MTNKTITVSSEKTKDIAVLGKRKRITRRQDAWNRMKRSKTAMLGLIITVIIVLVALFANVLIDYEKDCIVPNTVIKLQKPSAEHWLGTDALGRDILARIIYGARISLTVSIGAVLLSTFLGVIFGSVAGYYGGSIDQIIMRCVDIFASIPALLTSITIAAALGQSLIIMIIAIGVAGMPTIVRTVRATVLSVRGQDYVMAGKAMGGKDTQIIIFHLLPNCIAPIIVQSTMRISAAIRQTSSLSFLGIGVKPPIPEWGNMLSDGRNYLRQAGHLTFFPGLAIMITILAVNLLGDGLRDALDPRMRR